MAKTCSSCGKDVAGRFCSHCGTAVRGGSVQCGECAAELKPGAKFCNQCGAPADTAARPAASTASAERGGGAPIAWVVTGVAVVALLAAVLVPRFRSDAPTAANATFAPAGGMAANPAAGPQGIDLSSMTPREAADRLFDRVMRIASQGDTASALSFVPMALNAYEVVADMDADAHYHVATLHLLNGDAEQARSASDRILADDPNHLFGLYTAAQSEQMRGNEAGARDLYRRFLEQYPTEVTRDLPEYTAHAPAIPEMRAEAQAAVR
jgi:hypothetical protein